MADLVQVPGQPGIYVTPRFLYRLQHAERIYGGRLYLNPKTDNPLHKPLSGWRSENDQEYLYNGYLHHLPGFNIAAAPGHSNHERGEAGDLSLTTARAQAAMRLAGFIRDLNEDWHWNTPDASSHPIIPSLAFAGLDVSALKAGGSTMIRIKHVNGTNQARFVWNGQDEIWLQSKYDGDFSGLPGIEFHGTNAEFTAWRELNRINGGGAVILDQAAIDALAAAISPKLAIPTVQQIVVGITAWFKRP